MMSPAAIGRASVAATHRLDVAASGPMPGINSCGMSPTIARTSRNLLSPGRADSRVRNCHCRSIRGATALATCW